MNGRLKTGLRLAGLGIMIVLCIVFWRSGAAQIVTWSSLVQHHTMWAADVTKHPVTAPLAFIGIYALAVALSLPVGMWFSLLSGLLFGIFLGGMVTLIGASLGAIALFLMAQGLLEPFFRSHFNRQITRLRPGLERDGFAYLLALRLMPVFPFWLVNLAPALIGMRFWPYVAATVLGMIPTSFVLNAMGAGLEATLATGARPSAGMLLKPGILLPLLALAALAIMPAIWRQWQSRTKPRTTGSV